MQHYAFVTIWRYNAPIERVWQHLQDAGQWPQWWKGVVRVATIEEGQQDGLGSVRIFTFKSVLPYTLSFHSRVTAVAHLERIEGQAFGELDGYGVWTLHAEEGVTTVRYDWTVKTTKWWMNILAPVARPLFVWNHNVIMRWGGNGLAERLGCELLPL
jgi:hypothetical protein